ncbi:MULTISPECIES: LysR family transcriptional regulator [unclassified Mesorhizobium]|uniref:LysR family transcriptional regulator n=1 Tax=unclassified Mesorhizobium TaxID=325217 RepID=UPI001FDFABEC|nr:MULTISPECIES: LysR family transcriptional regulator [unclassified Mesorhizobium]
MLDLKLLATFVRAAHSGTLSAVAVQVGRTQSAVTMQVQRLEEALGQSLFHRSGSGVRLTGSGERFLAYAERILKTRRCPTKACTVRLFSAVPRTI